MKSLLVTIAIFACALTARAQRDEFAHLGNAHGRYTYWWLCSRATVQDSMAVRTNWQLASMGDKQSKDVVAYVSKDGNTARFFTFIEGLLIKQLYLTAPGTSEYDRLDGWFARTVALQDGSRFDRNSGLILNKKDTSQGTMFTIEPDWEDEQAIKTSRR